MLQYTLIRRAGWFLRWYRTFVTLDMAQLWKYLPDHGTLLDVGCGVGVVTHAMARKHPRLVIHGIDITEKCIPLAREFHSLPNITYDCRRIEDVTGQFDCLLFVDVFHHVPPAHRDSILQAAARLLKPDGFLLIKDISRRGGWVSFALDHYVSKYPANEIHMENLEDMTALVSRHLKVVTTEKRYRFPFPRYYIKAMRKDV